jgi:hypothetical protein
MKRLIYICVALFLVIPHLAVGSSGLSDDEMKEINKDEDAKWFVEQDKIYDQKLRAWKSIGLRYKDTFDRALLPKFIEAFDAVTDQWGVIDQRWQRLRIERPRGLGASIGKIEVEKTGKITCEAMFVTAKSFAVTRGKHSNEDKQTAKKLYLQLVTTFTGQAYEGCVRRARFELEALK